MKLERHVRIGLGTLVICGFSAIASAGDPPLVAAVSVEIGASTNAVLDLQRSGSAAGRLQPISGEVASRSYKRYLESFSQPLADGRERSAAPARSTTGSATR